jgi:trehalose 6-phosphate synthase
MMTNRHVVLVSDRGPVRFAKRVDGLVAERRNSSVTALLDGIATSSSRTATWVAPSDAAADATAVAEGMFDRLAVDLGYRYSIAAVSQQDYAGYYFDVGVNVIWTVWHGIEDEVPVSRSTEALLGRYRSVNQAVADQVAKVGSANAAVSVHDYQLLFVPAMVRARRDDVRIVHFSHTPFPDAGSLSELPLATVRSLVEGMLGADLLGFQRALWARRFLRCCDRLGFMVDFERAAVHLGDRVIWVRSYPVTADEASLLARARSSEVLLWADRIRTDDPRRVIARVDRLDPAKNALRGFDAYARLLERNPRARGDLRFVACLIPSRERLPSYRDYAQRVRRRVEEINDRHPAAITVYQGDDQDRAFGLLSVHDVLLVNPVSDGMNLVAQEAALFNGNDGVTVLSTTTGAADLLPDAVALNLPRSVEATTAALETALALPADERRERASAMRDAMSGAESGEWFEHQLADLEAVTSGSIPCCGLPGLADALPAEVS